MALRKQIIFDDILCKRCGKQTPAYSNSQLYCPECGPIVKKEKARLTSKTYRKNHPNPVQRCLEVEGQEDLEYYQSLTNWSFFEHGICIKCENKKDLNRFFVCKKCHSDISTKQMASANNPFYTESQHISQMQPIPTGCE